MICFVNHLFFFSLTYFFAGDFLLLSQYKKNCTKIVPLRKVAKQIEIANI